MTKEELSQFLEKHTEIEWAMDEDKGCIFLRHTYYDKEGEGLCVDLTKLPIIDQVPLEAALIGGRNVSQITRITGYFSVVEGWNKGKVGELKDRSRSIISS